MLFEISKPIKNLLILSNQKYSIEKIKLLCVQRYKRATKHLGSVRKTLLGEAVKGKDDLKT